MHIKYIPLRFKNKLLSSSGKTH